MKKPTTNHFFLGVKPDRSLLVREGKDMLSAKNMRILQRENLDLAAVNLRSTLPLDDLTEGFIPLGSAEYSGVTFIVSYSDATKEHR